MNRPRPPPTRTCSLPAPWQDSQPAIGAHFKSSLYKRACGLAGKIRAMFVWQSAQTLLPTKCAPSIPGGSTTLRSSVEQELTNKAAAPASASAAAKAFLAFIDEQSCDSGRRGFLSRRHLTKAGGHFKLQLHSGTKLFASRLTWKRFACGVLPQGNGTV